MALVSGVSIRADLAAASSRAIAVIQRRIRRRWRPGVVATATLCNPPDAQGQACAWPLTSLSANGVFVNWLTTRILEPRPSAGEAIAMNGESARLQTERPGSCAKIGADETISVWVPIGQPTPLSNVWVVACLRGPDLAAAEAQLRAMLASAVLGK